MAMKTLWPKYHFSYQNTIFHLKDRNKDAGYYCNLLLYIDRNLRRKFNSCTAITVLILIIKLEAM